MENAYSQEGLVPHYQTYQQQKCFIGYSQGAPWSVDLERVYQEVLFEEFDLEPWYADKNPDPRKSLRQKVVDMIANARYGIYDLSYWFDENTQKWTMPRNVFIELGIAIALNRPTLLLRHENNNEDNIKLPACLEGISDSIIKFSGMKTLKDALREHVPLWINIPPEQDWWNRYCTLGNRRCEYREAHPGAGGISEHDIRCHISDGNDSDRADFHDLIEKVLKSYNHLAYQYFDKLSFLQDYPFLLCTYCQTVRSNPFAIYRITPKTPAETFIAIGMSLALEKQFNYKIPAILLAAQVEDVPSLLREYEICTGQNDTMRKASLHKFTHVVVQDMWKTTWKARPLPFIEVVSRPGKKPQVVDRLATEEELLPTSATIDQVSTPTDTLICPSCGYANRPEAKFCRRDGGLLVPPSIPDQPIQKVLEPQVRTLLQKAYMLYTQKRSREAVAVYDQALQIKSQNPSAWQGRGLALALGGRHSEALESFEQALRLDPGLITSLNGKGTALNMLHRNKEALEVFEKTVLLEPDNAVAWNGKGAMLSALNQTEQALVAFDIALHFDMHMAQAWNNKGLILRLLKRYEEALPAFEQALSLERDNVIYWNGKGLVLYEMGRLKEAMQAYEEATNRSPDYAPALYGIGNVLYTQNKFKSALDQYDRAVKSDPNFVKAWDKRGNVLGDMGRFSPALESYEQALRLDPRYDPAWNGKASILCQLERFEEALEAYEQALRLNPNAPQAWNGKGNAYYRLGNYQKALEVYEQASRLNPKMASALHNMSLVLKQLGRYEEALEAAESALRLAPDDPDNWQRKAEALKKLRRTKEARAAEAEVVRLSAVV